MKVNGFRSVENWFGEQIAERMARFITVLCGGGSLTLFILIGLEFVDLFFDADISDFVSLEPIQIIVGLTIVFGLGFVFVRRFLSNRVEFLFGFSGCWIVGILPTYLVFEFVDGNTGNLVLVALFFVSMSVLFYIWAFEYCHAED